MTTKQELTFQEETKILSQQNRCQCCGNKFKGGVGVIDSYFLIGNEFIYQICSECHHKPYRQKLFLTIIGDIK